MKIILKSLLFSIAALTLTQPAVAMNFENILTNKYSLATFCGIAGYFTSNILDKKSQTIIRDKILPLMQDNDQSQKRTKFNENMKKLRETVQTTAPALIEGHINHYGLGSPLNSYLLINSFNFCQSVVTVINKLFSFWETTPSIDPKAIGVTSLYIAAGISQTVIPNLIKDQRCKPFAKYFLRGTLNQILEFLVLSGKENIEDKDLSQKKFNESVKDLVDFGINGGPLLKGLLA